jgi:hypothetical protein
MLPCRVEVVQNLNCDEMTGTSMDGIARVLHSFMSEVVLVVTLAFRLLRLFKSATRPKRMCMRSCTAHAHCTDRHSPLTGAAGSIRRVGYVWLQALVCMLIYTALLMPAFLRVGWFYFTSPQVRRCQTAPQTDTLPDRATPRPKP